MLTAITKDNRKINVFDNDIEYLKKLNKEKALFCPECGNQLILKSGTKKITHFSHVSKCNYKYSEPETEEHIKGKLIIRDWLIKKYPNARVELEYKVKETNQRTDVMLIMPDGKHYAFEFQCSTITESEWKERHELYKKANIFDFWILGSSRLNNLEHILEQSKNNLEAELKLSAFERAIESENMYSIKVSKPLLKANIKSIYYLDIKSSNIILMSNMYQHSKTKRKVVPRIVNLGDLILYDGKCGTSLMSKSQINTIKDKIENFKREKEMEETKIMDIYNNCLKTMRINEDSLPIFLRGDNIAEFTKYKDKIWKTIIFEKFIYNKLKLVPQYPSIINIDSLSILNYFMKKIPELIKKDCYEIYESNQYDIIEEKVGYKNTYYFNFSKFKSIAKFLDELKELGYLIKTNYGYILVKDKLKINKNERVEILYPKKCNHCGREYKFKEKIYKNYSLECRCGLDVNLKNPQCTCGSKMIIKTNQKDGSKFWACKNYPNCKSTISIRFVE